MKYCLVFIIIVSVTSLNKASYAFKYEAPLIKEFSYSQQEPFYFMTPVPGQIKLLSKIDLSFFKNRLIVNQYRYKLEIPNGRGATINDNLTKWSPWINYDFQEFLVPRLDQEGGYKFIVEYKTRTGSEIQKFEKLFYVYRVYPVTNAAAAKSTTTPVTDKTATKANPVTDKTAAQTTPVTDKAATKISPGTDKTTAKTTPVTDKAATQTTPVTVKTATKTTPVTPPVTGNISKGIESVNDKKTDLKDSKGNITPKTMPSTEKISTEPPAKPLIAENRIAPDYNKLLAEAIEKKDAALFRKSIQNGAGSEIKGVNGGNIFHIMDETIASEELISMLLNRGISINETDIYGNSPLHDAILSGKNEYARYLINNGADLNSINKLELSPLHLAAFLNNAGVANHLLVKGAEINLKGNSGYTALHIASEMNYIAIAKDLLYMGAKNNIKTDQKLTPRTIAKIQDNQEMFKLISKNGSYTINQPDSSSTVSGILLNSVKPSPRYDFSLPYDRELVKKRQFNRIIQIISIPVFVLSAATTTYLKIEADNYYSSYKNAETEDKARVYYDKMKTYDTFTYISGGISVLSVYGYIHSTAKKKNISRDMCKTYY